MKSNTYIKIYVILFIVFTFISCEDNTGPSNSAPEIQSISVNPEEVTPGSTVQVTAIAIDEDGDLINYVWSTEIGYVSEPNNPTTEWIIPSNATVNTNPKITLTVSDGKETDTDYERIDIIDGISVSGEIYYLNTYIPISGVTVNINGKSGTSNYEGIFEIEHVNPGVNTLIATKNDYNTYEQIIDVSSTNNEFIFNMTSNLYTNNVYGYITASDGTILSGIKADVLNLDGSNSEIYSISGNNGYYCLNDVPYGSRMISYENYSSNYEILDVDYQVSVGTSNIQFDPIVKFKRFIFEDINASDSTAWIGYNYAINNNHYTIYGGYMQLEEFISVPQSAEGLEVYLYHYPNGSWLSSHTYHRLYGIDENGNNFTQYWCFGKLVQNGEPVNSSVEPNWPVYGSEFKIRLDPQDGRTWDIYSVKLSYYW